MNEKKVSIIIPAYNVEKYISVGIKSALDQTYKNIEVIVVDDGSSDGTFNIMNKYANIDSRVKIYKKTNGGVSSARNLAMEKATGDYFMFLDSDDWLENNAVEDLLKLQQENLNKLVTVECYYAKYVDNECLREQQGINNDSISLSKEDSLISIDKEYRLRSSCFKLFKTSIVIDKKIQFNEKVSYGEDGLFVFEYLHYTNGIIYVPVPLWNILERPDSATMSPYTSKWLTWIDAIEIMIKNPKNSQNVKEYLYSYLQITIMTIMMIGIKCGKISDCDFKYLRGKLKDNSKNTCLPLYNKSKMQYFLLKWCSLNTLKCIWRLK